MIHVEQNSSILGPSGLKVGDVINSVNGCVVRDGQGWHHCLALSDHVSVLYRLLQKYSGTICKLHSSTITYFDLFFQRLIFLLNRQCIRDDLNRFSILTHFVRYQFESLKHFKS